jgi:3-oxoacyl-[acyl-carrier protein] reductase
MSDSGVVMITGAGGGLGSALAGEFLRQGWRVAAGFHNKPPSSDVAEVANLALDITSRDSVARAVDEVLTRWGTIDVLINNAGVTNDRAFFQMDDGAWEQVLHVNLKGAFLCSQAVCRPMMKQRNGHIVNISSFSGRTGQRGQANYAAAKAGLFGLTASVARELGSRNVRVNAVLPGVLPTKMTMGLSQAEMQQFAQDNALGRINSLEEVARFVVFLAGTKNISGQLFQLDSRIASWT